jgi:hypothetical protein
LRDYVSARTVWYPRYEQILNCIVYIFFSGNTCAVLYLTNSASHLVFYNVAVGMGTTVSTSYYLIKLWSLKFFQGERCLQMKKIQVHGFTIARYRYLYNTYRSDLWCCYRKATFTTKSNFFIILTQDVGCRTIFGYFHFRSFRIITT